MSTFNAQPCTASVEDINEFAQRQLEKKRQVEETERNKDRFLAYNLRRARYNQDNPDKPPLKQLSSIEHWARLSGFYKTLDRLRGMNGHKPNSNILQLNPGKRA